MYKILETLTILDQNNHCFNEEEEQAYEEVREWICDKLEEEHQRILDMSKPCTENIGKKVQAVYNDSLKAYEKEKEEFINILNLDGVNREIFKEVLGEIIEASPELFEDATAYRKPISSLGNAISEDVICAESKTEEYAMNREVDDLVRTKRKSKFTPPKQNHNTTKYRRCLNCKHHSTNQEDVQTWECTLKKINGLSVDGYCDEFTPRQ